MKRPLRNPLAWRSALRPLLAASVVGALAGCNGSPPGQNLFPLQAGHRWVYDVTTEWENNVIEHESRVFTSHGSEALADGAAWRRRSDSGVDYWLRADDSGIYRVATKSDLDAEPKPDATRRYVLKQPIAVGTAWQASTTAYLLQRRAEFPREIRHSHPDIPMTYTIEAVGQALDTRAGHFDGCVRVRGAATLKLFADPVVGWRDLALTTTEWYCPGAGLVKLVRSEPAQSTFLSGGTLTMELTEWH